MPQISSRPSWSGSLSFGLVTIPVRLHVATDDRKLEFNQLHAADGERVRQKKVCEGCGNEVSLDEIAKGWQFVKGEYVVVTDEDLAGLPLASKKLIDVMQFTDDTIDPVYLTGKHYYVQPDDDAGMRGYALLHRAMADSGVVAIGRVAFREQKEYLVVIRPREDTLVLETLHFHDEVRVPNIVDLPDVPKRELAVAGQLVESMTEGFDIAAAVDGYRTQLTERLEAKAAGKAIPAASAPATPVSTGASDLMAALQASVKKQAKPRRKVAAKKPAARRKAS